MLISPFLSATTAHSFYHVDLQVKNRWKSYLERNSDIYNNILGILHPGVNMIFCIPHKGGKVGSNFLMRGHIKGVKRVVIFS